MRSSWLSLVSLAASFWLSTAMAAQPLSDRLSRPSEPSASPERSLLTSSQAVDGRVVAVGESGRILLIGPSGAVEQAQVPVDLLLTSVFFSDPQHGWAVGHDGVILHSVDGAKTWTKQADGEDVGRLMLAHAKADVARLEGESPDAEGEDAHATALDNAYFALEDIEAGIAHGPSRPLMDVWFRDASNGWAVGAYGTLLRTRDGGKSWAYVPGLENPDRLHLNAVLGLDDGSLIVAGEGGRLYRSADDGERWLPPQTLTQASLYKLLALRDGRVLALGFGGTLFVSSDQGQRWDQLELPTQASLYGGTQLQDGSVLLTGQGGVLLRSENGLNYGLWQAPVRAPWLDVSTLPDGSAVIVGVAGLRRLTSREFEEQFR